MMTSLFSQLLHLTIIVIGNGRQALFASRQDGKKVDWTLEVPKKWAMPK